MKRILLFARSVIPEDPSQLLLLAGSVLLLICTQLRCHPAIPEYENPKADPGPVLYQLWLHFSVAARLPIFLAGAAGLFICFWPGLHAARRILVFVLFPAFTGIAVICGRFLYISRLPGFPRESVMEPGFYEKAGALGILWGLGPALHMSVLGLVFTLIFLWRLATGAAHLPVSVAHNESPLADGNGTWTRILVLVFISFTCMPSIINVVSSILRVLYRLASTHGYGRLLPPGRVMSEALAVAFLSGIAAWAAGEGRWKELRESLRPPETKFGMLGLIIPTAIQQVPDLLAYISDRIHWAALYFGKLAPPVFSTYFTVPNPFYYWVPNRCSTGRDCMARLFAAAFCAAIRAHPGDLVDRRLLGRISLPLDLHGSFRRLRGVLIACHPACGLYCDELRLRLAHFAGQINLAGCSRSRFQQCLDFHDRKCWSRNTARHHERNHRDRLLGDSRLRAFPLLAANYCRS
jgi:hypothetical protein